MNEKVSQVFTSETFKFVSYLGKSLNMNRGAVKQDKMSPCVGFLLFILLFANRDITLSVCSKCEYNVMFDVSA